MRSPSQLEMNPKLPATTREKQRDSPSTQDEALFQSSVSRKTPHFFLKCDRVLVTLDASQEGPQDTRPCERNTEFPTTTQEEPRFPLLILRWGSCFVCKGIPMFPSHLRRRPVSYPKSFSLLCFPFFVPGYIKLLIVFPFSSVTYLT